MASEESGKAYPAKRLEGFIAAALTALGLPRGNASVCAARMTEADLRGVDTHGIFRLPHSWERTSMQRSSRPARPAGVIPR